MRGILLIMSILILTPALVQANGSDYLSEKITQEDIPFYMVIIGTAETREKAEKLATNGNTFVKNNMTWDVILPKYIKFYEDLLKN